MSKYPKKAFTLVELIVVITILAILGTIAFISFQGYSKQARDSRRTSDISNIKTSLELFSLNNGKYPIPDDFGTVSYSGETLFIQGVVGDNVTQNLSANLQEKPLDPLHDIEYIYSTTDFRKEYEVLCFYEGNLSKAGNQIYAANIYKNKISGNYNGVFLRTTNFIVPLPSIITSETLSYDLYDDTTKVKSTIISSLNNYPEVGVPGILHSTGQLDINFAYTGSISNSSTDVDKISVLNVIQTAYTGSDLSTIGVYANILSRTTDEEKLVMVEDMILKNRTSGTIVKSQDNGSDTLSITGDDSNTVLLLHGDDFSDSSSSNHIFTGIGNVSVSDTGKFGKSLYFDGSGDYLITTDHGDWDLGTGDFTIDTWFYQIGDILTSGYDLRAILSTGNYGVSGYEAWGTTYGHHDSWGVGTRIGFGGTHGTVAYSYVGNQTLIPSNEWHHLVIERKSGNLRYFLNGTLVDTYISNDNILSSGGSAFYIGVQYAFSGLHWYFNGYLDELRISKGIARTTDPKDYLYDPEGNGFDLPIQEYGN